MGCFVAVLLRISWSQYLLYNNLQDYTDSPHQSIYLLFNIKCVKNILGRFHNFDW